MKRTCKRALSMLLVLIMLLGVLPMTALAASGTGHKIAVKVYKVVLDSSKPQGYQNPELVTTKTVVCQDKTAHSGYNHFVNLKEFYPTNVDLSITDWTGWQFNGYYEKGKDKTTFYSWTKDQVNATANVTGSEPYPCSKNFYLVYKEASTAYTLNYDANGGTGAPSQQTGSSSTGYYDFTVSSVEPTKDGWHFMGWEDRTVSPSVIYTSGNSIRVSNPTTKTIYAVWGGHEDADGDGFCDNGKECLHDHDSNGYCTEENCDHPHEGENPCCPLEPHQPEKPFAPSENDLPKILSGNIVTVHCTTAGSGHEDKEYVLLTGGYTIGSVEGDKETGYYCDVTIKLATYVAEYNNTLPGHTAAEGETDQTIRLNYWGSGDGFGWTPSPSSVTFNVVCRTPEQKPEHPVRLMIYRNGDTANAFYTFNLGSFEKDYEYDVGDLEISDYYSSAYGFEFEGWYNDGGWNQYKAGNKNSKLGDKITINGWTNLHAMVYDKYPVYANVYHNDDTSKPVASELLGYYPHGTSMAGILEDKGLTGSLDSLYTSTYGYDWDKIWSHEISNYPTPVGNRTVSGWTNLCTMVYDKVPVVYFRTLEDLNLYQNPETRDNDLILEMTTASVGSALPTPDAPTAVREGYTFLYWSKEGQAEDVTGQTVSGWTNLYAAWEANSYTIVYHGNGGTLANGRNQSTTNCTYDAEATIKNNPFTREGWTFLGWAKTADGYKDDIIYTGGEKVINLTAEPNGKVHLYAVWTPNQTPLDPIVAAYKVEHYVEQLDGSYTLADTDFPLYGELGATVTAEAKSYEHYSVDEEMSAATKSDEVIMPSMGNDGQPVILTLKLFYKLDRFTVTYTDGVANRTVFDDQIYTVPYGAETPAFDGTPKRAGYVFTGWTPAVAPTVTGDVVYKATWRRVITPVVEEKDDPFYVRDLNYEDHVAYINGYPDGTVRPTGDITRAEAATIFFRLMTDSARNKYWRETSRFTDVADSAWYAVAVATLDKYGAIVDSENGEFRPDEPITRAELAVMAAQFCTLKYDSTKTSFTDVSRNYWAAKEIALIEQAGWIVGHNGKFRPNDTITRAETITIINRMLHRGVDDEGMLKGMIKFSDNVRSAWYYEAVQEAANSHTYTYSNRWIPGEGFHYENWQKLVKNPDWVAIERGWKDAHK